jgi:hypothetical protein
MPWQECCKMDDATGFFMTGRFLESQQVEPHHSLDPSAKKR